MSIATQGEGVNPRDGAPVSGVIDELAGMFVSARAALADFLDLLSLEARRAGLARRTGPRPGNTVEGLRDTAVTSVLGLLRAIFDTLGTRTQGKR